MAGIFLTIVQTSSEFVGGQCASWRLPPKAAVSAYRRHSFVEGIRNGGLDFVKAAVGLSVGHGDCLLYDGFFLLPSSGRKAFICLYFIKSILLPSDIYLTNE